MRRLAVLALSGLTAAFVCMAVIVAGLSTGPVGPVVRERVAVVTVLYSMNGSRVRITPVHTYLLNGSVGEECLLNGEPMKGPATIDYSVELFGAKIIAYVTAYPNCTVVLYCRDPAFAKALITHEAWVFGGLAAVGALAITSGATLIAVTWGRKEG